MMNAHNTIENTRTDLAWDGFAADVALWVDRAGEHLSAIAHRHGVQVTRHELEAALESIVRMIEDTWAIDPRPETATAEDARSGLLGMAAAVAARRGAGDQLGGAQQWATAAGDVAADAFFEGMSPRRGSSSDKWRGASQAIAVDAYLDGLAAGARIDTFAASLKRVTS